MTPEQFAALREGIADKLAEYLADEGGDLGSFSREDLLEIGIYVELRWMNVKDDSDRAAQS